MTLAAINLSIEEKNSFFFPTVVERQKEAENVEILRHRFGRGKYRGGEKEKI